MPAYFLAAPSFHATRHSLSATGASGWILLPVWSQARSPSPFPAFVLEQLHTPVTYDEQTEEKFMLVLKLSPESKKKKKKKSLQSSAPLPPQPNNRAARADTLRITIATAERSFITYGVE